MADEIASLVVKITGDASGLEATLNSASSALSSFSSAQGGVTAANGAATKGLASYNQKMSQTEETLKSVQKAASAQKWQETGKSIKNVGESIDTITKPLQVASAATLAIGAASAAAAINFEDSFASVEKTVEGTPEQLEEIKQGIIDLTTTGIDGGSAIPMTTAELNELAAAGGQLGIETENILEFTETMAQLETATNLSGEEGAQTVARLMNVTGESQNNIDRLGSSIVDLGNNFATTESEIANMALNLGATSSIVGFSTQDTLAYATALSSMGVEAAAGGSAVSRIIMDIQSAVSAGGESLDKFAATSGKTSKEFADQWKSDASGAFYDLLEGLSRSEDIIGELSNLGFANIRDIQALQRLASDTGLDLLAEALERSNTAWEENTALQEEFEKKRKPRRASSPL